MTSTHLSGRISVVEVWPRPQHRVSQLSPPLEFCGVSQCSLIRVLKSKHFQGSNSTMEEFEKYASSLFKWEGSWEVLFIVYGFGGYMSISINKFQSYNSNMDSLKIHMGSSRLPSMVLLVCSKHNVSTVSILLKVRSLLKRFRKRLEILRRIKDLF